MASTKGKVRVEGVPTTIGIAWDNLRQCVNNGDRVTIVDRFGAKRTGRAVMFGPAGWVLNMGGRYGTPAIANENNIVKIVKADAVR